ncbi:hypothetical protein JCM10550A_16260 [Methanogenium cariaci]
MVPGALIPNLRESAGEWTTKGMGSVAAGGRNEKALEYYDTAIRLDSQFADTCIGKAVALFNDSNPSQSCNNDGIFSPCWVCSRILSNL